MSTSSEHIHPEITDSAEKPKETVERFMRFTETVLLREYNDSGVRWEDEMYKFYGNEERMRVAKSEAYKDGVPGIKEYLESAYETGGILGLEIAFFDEALPYTRAAKIADDIIRTAFIKILDFK